MFGNESNCVSFDKFDHSYQAVVQESVSFSGLSHDFFLNAKAVALEGLLQRHFGSIRPSLLDIGCGVGAMHGHLERLVGRLAGTDPSQPCIARAGASFPNHEYRTMVGSQVPFDNEAFDVTLAVCVFHHVPPPKQPALLAEMRRVTRPGGLTILIEHNPFNPLTRLAVLRCPFDEDAVLLSASQAQAMLRNGHYNAVSQEHILLLPFRSSWAHRVERLTRHLPLGAQYLSWGTR